MGKGNIFGAIIVDDVEDDGNDDCGGIGSYSATAARCDISGCFALKSGYICTAPRLGRKGLFNHLGGMTGIDLLGLRVCEA